MLKKQITSLACLWTLHAILLSAACAEDISTSGWKLWPDRDAAWKDDALYLPAEVRLHEMPVNPPTGGWQALNEQQGIAVTLPTTVEEHYWGKFGTRPYTKNEAQRGAGTSFQNGNYLGVSWWWREVQIPEFKPGQRVVVSFRGARLRSEVYCNGKLVGYTIMGELPFQADLTDSVKPGQKAQLAVRITNPGGHLDWIDFAQMQIQWGKYTLPPSHGFGGLDNDIQLDVRDNVSISDLATLNKPDLREIHLVAEVTSVSENYAGPVQFTIQRNGKALWSGTQSVKLEAGKTATVELDARVDSAVPWDVKNPNLYQAKASLPGKKASARSVSFGFRYFTAEGIGSEDAKLTLNGKRSVPISAISWGFWGRNGLWPDQEMAEREVSNAKKLGLNTLQFHRNIGKPAVLDIQDREGLMRCEEPGGGKFVIGHRYSVGPFGPNGEFLAKDEALLDALKPKKDYVQPDSVDTTGAGPDGDGVTFWEKYAEEKILEMVKRDRSHPSLIMYTLQNESSDMDLRNPRIYRIFRKMHAMDPSRIIAFYSGGTPKEGQVLMLPYSDEIRYGSKTLLYAGWKDVHTCGGPCNYLDHLYKNPRNFKQMQKEEDRKSICVWGEMLGAACPDDYSQIIHSFDAKHPTGYELADMTAVLDGYHQFLDKYGFRKAFPTDSSLFQAVGYRTYYFWRRIVEQSRIDNANDYLAISGWESTTIDNHSGIVDNHRFLKGDPSVLAEACQPELLVIQPRHMNVAKGEKNIVDLFLINETNRTGPQKLVFNVKRPNGSVAFTVEKEVNATGGDTYGQLLVEGIEFASDTAELITLEAILTPKSGTATTLKRSDPIHIVDVAGTPIFQKIAVVEPDQEVTKTLQTVFHVTPVKLSDTPATERLDAIVLANKSVSWDLFKPADAPKAAPVSQNLVPESMQGAAAAKSPTPAPTPIPLEISKEAFENALNRVKNDGTRLVLWPDNNHGAEAFLKELVKRKIVLHEERIGNLGAPWFGTWFFVRKHWLLEGLPTDCAMDWRYGISAFGGPEWLHENPKGTNTDGFLVDGPGIEAVVGYGADHNPKVGMSGFVVPYGKGQIVFYCLPQLVRSLQPGEFAISLPICQRLLGNALRPTP